MNQSQSFGSTGLVSKLFIPSLNCWRNESVVRPSKANATMANCDGSRFDFARLHRAGISFRFVRSPLAPKITIMQGSGTRFFTGFTGFMRAYLLPFGRGL